MKHVAILLRSALCAVCGYAKARTQTLRRRGALRVLAPGLAGLLFCGAAAAGLVDYSFTLTRPLQHFSETLGGPGSPLTFKFRVDSGAPNLEAPYTMEGLYGFGYGLPGFGTVSLGGTTTQLEGGIIQIGHSASFDVFNGTANGYDDGTRMLGRSLFVSAVSLWDFSGQMFSNIGLPLDDGFSLHIGAGNFALIFRPTPQDREFPSGGYVKFDTFIAPSDVTVTRTVVATVPEPSTYALVLAALSAAGFASRRRTR